MWVGLLMLWACGSQPVGWEDSGSIGVEMQPTWAGVQALFSVHCDICHDGSNQFELRAAIKEDLEQATELLVIPGDLQGSVLWDALAGTTLTRMMPPSGRLQGDEVQHVADWILAGAEME